jgi:peptide/nickel transport system substrate-binding protein
VRETYWTKALRGRIGRRRAIALTAGTATAAAILAACGGGSSQSSGGAAAKTGLATKPVDTTGQARKGGVLKDRLAADPPTLDQVSPIAATGANTSVYGTLVQEKRGYLSPSVNDLDPNVAESWELAPDGLQITMKVRQGMKWHNRPPVNGRIVDIDDVLFSWNRFATKSSNRVNLANAANPAAPVLSFTAADSRTIVVKLKEPLVYTLALFASYGGGGHVDIVPKETDSTLDIRNDMIGTGPFMMTNYTPSVGFTIKRNPDFYDKDWAFVDQVDLPIISEYAAALAQLKAGNIFSFAARAEDIVSVKREEPNLQIFQNDFVSTSANRAELIFGLLPEGKSPFLDERVRQAFSMSWDRDLYLDTIYNTGNLEKDGLPVAARWNSVLGGWWEGAWLDPQSKDFGPNAKFFKHDLAEAKKLLAAAGLPNGINTVSNYVRGPELYPDKRMFSVLDGMSGEGGFVAKPNPVDYTNDYIPNYRDTNGQYEGWTYASAGGGGPATISPVAILAATYWSRGGVSFKGFSASGKNDKSGDPQVDAMIEKARLEFDPEKGRALLHDIQRYMAKAMWGLTMPGVTTEFSMAWPALANYRVWSTSSTSPYYRLWLDDSKPPVRKT